MTHPVIDTLRLADRLKESGFEDRQAEGLARALGNEITEHLVTKADLDAAVETVRGDYRALDEKFCGKFDSVDARFDSVDARLDSVDSRFDAKFDSVDARFDSVGSRFDARFDSVDARFDSVDSRFESVETRFESVETRFDSVDARFESVDARFDSVDSRFDALDAKFEAKFNALNTQIKFIFAMLGVLMALGLVETVLPLLA